MYTNKNIQYVHNPCYNNNILKHYRAATNDCFDYQFIRQIFFIYSENHRKLLCQRHSTYNDIKQRSTEKPHIGGT